MPSGRCLPSGFRDVNPPHRHAVDTFFSQFLRQFVQPRSRAVRLDVRERLAVDPRCAAVGTAALVGEFQNVSSVHLVVERVEAIAGRSLRFGMQRRLEFLNLFWRS